MNRDNICHILNNDEHNKSITVVYAFIMFIFTYGCLATNALAIQLHVVVSRRLLSASNSSVTFIALSTPRTNIASCAMSLMSVFSSTAI